MKEQEENKIRRFAMYRRLAYMAIALTAVCLMKVAPVFSFSTDKGIIYDRSFTMDLQEFQVIQTTLDTNIPYVWETMSVNGLYVLQQILFWTLIACIVVFYPTKVRWYLSLGIAAAGGVFYFLLIHYALRISDLQYATLAPTWVAFLPAVVIAMMILLNRNVAKFGNYFDDIIEE